METTTRTASERNGQEEVMDLLADHVPLSLLMDLAMPAGPHSRDLLHTEGLPAEPWWEAR